ERKRTRKFICDGAFVSDLSFKAGKPSKQEGDVDVEGKVSIAAEHGQDKRVDVLAEILRGDEVLATSPKITHLKVEEDEQTTRPLAFHLLAAQLKDSTDLKVRLTIDVETKE
ncbi:MAG TPA: hypothetical protein VFK70_13505, partial [Vicinamibacteria bacterium]|nr:hypothetical protein [Vicinamibacteria bacterium]